MQTTGISLRFAGDDRLGVSIHDCFFRLSLTVQAVAFGVRAGLCVEVSFCVFGLVRVGNSMRVKACMCVCARVSRWVRRWKRLCVP